MIEAESSGAEQELDAKHAQSMAGLPNEEEQVATGNRGEHPPSWRRILIVSFFSLLASGVTHALWVSHLRHLLTPWSIPALFWLIAVIAAIDAFMPRPDRQWTGFVVSGAFGALAVIGIAGIIYSGNYRFSRFFGYTLLMAGLSIGCTTMSVRKGKRQSIQ